MYKSRQYEVIRNGNIIYGKKTLQSIDSKASDLVFGGEIIAQSIIAAWELVPEQDWTPNSFHGYFIRPAKVSSIIRYEVIEQSNGKNFKNRLVNCYQDDTGKLCFVAMISFGYKDGMKQKKIDYHNAVKPNIQHVPFEFQFKPNRYFYQYKHKMQDLIIFNHTNDHIQVMLPPEIFEDAEEDENKLEVGERRLGFFTRVNVDGKQPKEVKANYVDLAFITDATILVLFFRSLGTAFNFKYFWYTYASMDHSIYFHDNDFDVTEWIFMDYKFLTLSNGRVTYEVHGYNPDGKLVITVYQQAQVQIPLEVADLSTGGSYKL